MLFLKRGFKGKTYRLKSTSATFLDTQLAACANTLVKSEQSNPLLKELRDSKEQKELLLRKSMNPYSFATSVDRLCGATELPPHSIPSTMTLCAKTSMKRTTIEHTKRIWEVFKVVNMMELSNLYLRTDS